MALTATPTNPSTTHRNGLRCLGQAYISGALAVDGATELDGDVDMNGTLAVDGATTLTGAVTITSGSAGAPLLMAERVFTQGTNAAGVFTGSVTVPAGATIIDIRLYGEALWNQGTSAVMIVGDVADPDGWWTAVNLQATDLLAGEVLSFYKQGSTEVGVYQVAATGLLNTSYSASARIITGEVTTVGTVGATGITRMVVLYALPATSAATFVAT